MVKPGGALTLAPNSNLVIETRNAAGESGFIDLTDSYHKGQLDIKTSGSGTISIRSGFGGSLSTPIWLPNLISASDIYLSAGGGRASKYPVVRIFGTVSGANIDVDATGSVAVDSGARIIAGGAGTSLTIDAAGITLGNGEQGAATLSNSGTGTVSLTSTGKADIELGEFAIASGVGLLSLSSGYRIVAINRTDVSDVVNEITSAGAVSLTAQKDIGSDSNQIEIAGVTDLIVDLGKGDLFLSGSDGAGGSGRSLAVRWLHRLG